MNFFTANYETYVVLGDPAVTPLWNWRIWQLLLPKIDLLVRIAREKPAVRCTQYLPNQAGTVKFGRLGWKESDHQKWTHDSPINADQSKSWSFLNLQVWAPAWTVCEQENQGPDVFLGVLNESLMGASRQEPIFNPVVVFAVRSELAQNNKESLASLISALRYVMSPKLLGYCHRPWGKAVGSTGLFTNSIQDLPASGLFKAGPRHKGEVGFHLLEGEWQPA